MYRLLGILLKPTGYRDVEDDRIAIAVDVNKFRDEVRAEPVPVATCPVHYEPLLLFLLGPCRQRQHAADRTAAG